MQTDVIFSFDTEDYTTERNADAILALATMLTEEGVKGHFAVVGLVAQQLVAWGRHDVLKALEPHVLGYHSYSHSMHPVMAELCDVDDYDVAHKRIEDQEGKGLEILRNVFGDKKIWFAVPPGVDVSYPALYYYAEQGIPFYFGGYIHNAANTLVDYCEQTQIPYSYCMEGLFMGDKKTDVEALLNEMSTKKRVIFYHHPNMSVKKVFWDILNYKGANKREFGEWIEAEERPEEETLTFWNRFRALIRRLKADDRFVITDAETVWNRRCQHAEKGSITKEDIATATAEWDANGLGITNTKNYSVADIFNAAATILTGKSTYEPGLVKGMLNEPVGISEAVTVTRQGVKKAAQAIHIGDFIQPSYSVDGTNLGPADFLYAMRDAIMDEKEEITLTPRPQLVSLDDYPGLQQLTMRGQWVFSPDFKDEFLSKRLRLQCWTLRNYRC